MSGITWCRAVGSSCLKCGVTHKGSHKANISNCGLHGCIEQDIVRLDVAVAAVVCVEKGQTLGSLEVCPGGSTKRRLRV